MNPFAESFSLLFLIDIIAISEIQTTSVQPEKTGVWEREIYVICFALMWLALQPHKECEYHQRNSWQDEKCFIEWCCQLQRLYSISGKRNQIKVRSTSEMIPIWKNWITQRKICSSAILSATICTSTGLRSKHRPLQLENGDWLGHDTATKSWSCRNG
jgi:hypothetical protein